MSAWARDIYANSSRCLNKYECAIVIELNVKECANEYTV